jgi:hypothetical protein
MQGQQKGNEYLGGEHHRDGVRRLDIQKEITETELGIAHWFGEHRDKVRRKDMQERIQEQSQEIGYQEETTEEKLGDSSEENVNIARRLDIRVQSTEKRQEIGNSD